MIQTDLVEFHWEFMGHHGFHGDSMGSIYWVIEWECHGMYGDLLDSFPSTFL